jgi:hypothetical protein
MIGRQGLYVTQREMRRLLASAGRQLSETEVADICDAAGGYSEVFFKLLGAAKTHSFDYSDYESPTYTYDMNEPIPDNFKEAYTAVLDGGSLEHIFNFPVAIKNCMEMVRVGGHYLAITPANNFFGHGFYQFSPELYFTVLSEENGFDVEKIIAFEETTRPVWYVVKNPREIAERVTLSNSFPVFLLVIAKKVARRPIFERTPQQSDYVALWKAKQSEPSPDSDPREPRRRPFPIRVAKMILPFGVRKLIRSALGRPEAKAEGFDPRFFERMDRAANQR